MEQLRIVLPGPAGGHVAVRNVGVSVAAGETVGLVGYSGSGKTLTALAVLGLLPRAARVSGRILFGGQNLLTLPERRLRAIRGRSIAAIFQDPNAALNPLRPVGSQIGEVLRVRRAMNRRQARLRGLELLRAVGIDRPEVRQFSYPHQLSGGEAQRVLIAMAFAVQPELLIADEPTTALDTRTGRQVMDLLVALKREHGFGLILISHDRPLVSRVADRVVVIEHGVSVSREAEATAPAYARGAGLGAGPAKAPKAGPPVLELKNLTVRFTAPRRGGSGGEPPAAVDGVSLELANNEILALVGRSGCGKTTVARAIAGLNTQAGGEILFLGKRLAGLESRRSPRVPIQMVFQDPYTTLNPRRTVRQALAEALQCGGRDAGAAAVAQLLRKVELGAEMSPRYPHELSAGERQRVAIARALAASPRLLLLDEPMSSLDYPVRIRLLRLLERLRRTEGLTMLLISHDLELVRAWADRIVKMRRGRVVEQGDLKHHEQN